MYFETDMNEMMNTHKDVLVFVDTLPLHSQIKLKRVFNGFSQAELAAKLGMGAPFLCEIERGQRRIPDKYVDAISRYLYIEHYEDGELVDIIDQG